MDALNAVLELRRDLVRVDIVPEPFDKLRTFGSASGVPSILEQAFQGEL